MNHRDSKKEIVNILKHNKNLESDPYTKYICHKRVHIVLTRYQRKLTGRQVIEYYEEDNRDSVCPFQAYWHDQNSERYRQEFNEWYLNPEEEEYE